MSGALFVATDAPPTAAGLHGPDLPASQAPADSISARSPAEVFGALESAPQGLTATMAASRLTAIGPNELRAAKRPPVIKKVLAQFTNLFALVLLGASVITFASYLIQSPRDTGSLELAVAILAVVVLNGAIGFFQEYSARRHTQAGTSPRHGEQHQHWPPWRITAPCQSRPAPRARPGRGPCLPGG